jgi:hypothetical protein
LVYHFTFAEALPMGAVTALRSQRGVKHAEAASDTLWNVEMEKDSVVPDLASALVQAGARLAGIQRVEATLEEVYFRLQNRFEGGL